MDFTDPNLILVPLIVLAAIFTQSLTGFGSGLVAMALLPPLLGIRTAAPIVALTSATLEFVMLFRYRNHVTFHEIWRLLAGAVIGIPMGVLALRNLDERMTMHVLGVVIIGYAVYSLLNLHMPRIPASPWGYGFGLIAGLLGGAYNTSGPPVVIYGTCQKWGPGEFKGNLQSFFVVNDIAVITGHALSANLTPIVWSNYWLALPAVLIGMIGGWSMDRFINPELFRRIVLMLLVVLGLRLLFL